MSVESVLSRAGRLGPAIFLPVRKLAGPLHRRRRALESDQNEEFPPLPAPWDDPRWFRGDFPPRRHNLITPLLHGEEYFDDLVESLLSARERVTICGWSLTPLLSLGRDHAKGEAVLADVLREVTARAQVLILLWAGAPALFEPSRSSVAEAQKQLREVAPGVQCMADGSAGFGHDHHQKAVTIDGRVAYVGGIDLSTFQGDRWDTREHRLRFGPNWHDVQLKLQGEVVQDVEENFRQRWNASVPEADALEPAKAGSIEPAWDEPAQVVRTIPRGFYSFAPDGIFGIHHALCAAIRSADRFVYLENQYIWAPEIVAAVADAMNRPRSSPFHVMLVLPAKAFDGKYDNDAHVRRLSEIDAGRGMFSAYSLYASGPASGSSGYRYLPIYVHAKVSVVDDEWFSVGSANLNRRGLATDAEMNVQAIAPEVARPLRVRLWAEHLGLPEDQVATSDPLTLVPAWQAAANEMEDAIRSAGKPPLSQVRKYVPGGTPGSRTLDVLQDISLEH